MQWAVPPEYSSPLSAIPGVKTKTNKETKNQEPKQKSLPSSMASEPLADQLTLHMLQTKMEPSSPGWGGGVRRGGDGIAKLFKSCMVSGLPGWPNHRRHLISLSYLDRIDGGLQAERHERASAIRMLNRENKPFCWGIRVNSALQLSAATVGHQALHSPDEQTEEAVCRGEPDASPHASNSTHSMTPLYASQGCPQKIPGSRR